jgi:hypothetical protein
MRYRTIPFLTFDTSRHGQRRVYYRRGRGPRVRLPDDLNSAEFVRAYHAAVSDIPIEDVRHMKPTPIQLRRGKTEDILAGAIRSARTRARQKGVPFALTIDHLIALVRKNDYRCEITGIEFFAKHTSAGRVNPYTPSIDRIEPKLGYVEGNVRVVIYAVNAMILDWGEPLFIRVANSYRYWSRTKNKRKGPSPSRGTRPAPLVKSNSYQV